MRLSAVRTWRIVFNAMCNEYSFAFKRFRIPVSPREASVEYDANFLLYILAEQFLLDADQMGRGQIWVHGSVAMTSR